MHEGDDPDDEEYDSQERMSDPRPAAPLSSEHGKKLFDARDDDHDPEEDGNRRDSPPVEAEDDDREEQPAGSDDKEDPPEAGGCREAAFYVDVGDGENPQWTMAITAGF
jgi:hypothetical protein